MKKHSVFIILFASALLLFLRELITMKGGFLYGDYSDQFYPWSMIYAGNIKNLVLPFWTRYVQSGFPVMAEGQIGGFYPPHMIFYFLFPFRFAYNYLTVIHFALAGIFTYIYTKKMGGCEWGSALAAFIFCFGGAYAGCMINTATLKALTWLPLVLFLYEKYFESRKPAILAFAGVATGLQLLSGAPQAALYSAFLCLVYFLTGLGVRSKVRFSDIAWMSMTMAIAAGIFLPQFVLTKVLAGLSWRSGANLDFALSGSFSPLAFISVVFPYPVPGGARVYIGLLSVLFLMAAVRQNLKTRTIYPIFAVLAVSVFVALGKYNPLFAAMIRFFRIYDFRGPSKAILFTIFSMSVLSGIGFTVFFEKGKDRQFYLRIFSGFLSFMLVVFLASKAVLVIFKDRIISLGEYLVTRDIYGQPFHRHDLSIYLKKVKGFYDSMVASSSFSLWPNLFSVLLCAGLIAVCFYVLTGKKKIIVFTRSAAAALIFIDLAVFSSYGTGFRGNIRNFDFVDPAYSEIFKVINKDKTLFRIFPYNVASAKLPNWTVPSLNSIYGIDSIALYTPLANEYYRKELEELEVVDNALGLKAPQEGSLGENRSLIEALNVKYVISPEKLNEPWLDLVVSEGEISLYRLKETLPRAFAAKQLSFEGIDRSIPVAVVRYSPGYAVFELEMPYAGFLVFSENRYPGWNVKVNGKTSRIEPFSVIQAVSLSVGKNVVEFKYSAFSGLASNTEM